MTTSPDTSYIRVSMLDGYGDCGLRAAINQWPRDFTSRGMQPEWKKKHIGAAVGQGVHSAIARAFLSSSDDAIAYGINAFEEEIKEGFDGDPITPDKDAGVKVVGKLFRSYFGTIGYKLTPTQVEEEFIGDLAQIKPGYYLTMHPDYVAADALADTKTGRIQRFHPRQLGGYLLGLKAKGLEPKFAKTIFLRRVGIDKDADRPVETMYETAPIKKMAVAQIKRIITDREQFLATGDPMSYPVNPSSQLCGERWCAAWGTPICPVWKIKENETK